MYMYMSNYTNLCIYIYLPYKCIYIYILHLDFWIHDTVCLLFEKHFFVYFCHDCLLDMGFLDFHV